MIAFSPGTGSSAGCEVIMDCVGSNVGDGLVYNDAANRIATRLSSNTGNVADFGTDGGLYVAGPGTNVAPGYGYGTTNTVTITEGLTDTVLTPTLDYGTTGDFTVSGTNVVLARAGLWWLQCFFRFECDVDYEATPPAATVYGRVAAGTTDRDRYAAASVSRDSTLYSIQYMVMMDLAAGATVQFIVRKSTNGWATNPTSFGEWGLHRIGPSLAYNT